MAKYIKCDGCGKSIFFGEEVYKYSGYCGLFCSTECFANSYAEYSELTEELADDCRHEVYDDEKRKKELRRLISEFERTLYNMKTELEDLEGYSI